jgi:hypothetical protein
MLRNVPQDLGLGDILEQPKQWNKEMRSGTSAFVISSFRRGINEIFALLECYAEFTGS